VCVLSLRDEVGISATHIETYEAFSGRLCCADRAEAGEEIVITRQGKAVAHLISAPKTLKSLPSLAEFRRKLGQPGTSSVQLLREERDDQ
jgi:antitoxin (DNA-binding transcriptional repressor) of toxin-antitoxin stability system